MDSTAANAIPKPFVVYWAIDDPATRLQLEPYLSEQLPNAIILHFDSVQSLLAALDKHDPRPDMILFNDPLNPRAATPVGLRLVSI